MNHAEQPWKPASGCLRPAGGEIHFFRASLDPPPHRIYDLRAILSADESERARRFRRESDQERFVAGRGQLREILGAMLQIEPGVLSFEYGPFGKPCVAAPVSGRSLHFNLAHARALAIYAIATEEIGVDVECVRPISEAEAIAERFFARAEAARLHTLPEDERMRAFFTLWTRKEALIKALGVSVGDARLAKETRATWMLESFEPAADHVGGFATKIREPRLFWWNWP